MKPDMVRHDDRPVFGEPSTDLFLYAGWCVDPPRRLPFVRRSAKRQRMIERCREFAAAAEGREGVVTATAYETELIPPLPDIPRYDVLMLIRTRTLDALHRAEASVRGLAPDFVMPARNSRRIGDTDRTRRASFLFNHFAAQRPAVAIEAFDQVAGWFPDKLGVDNTTLLQPVDEAAVPYAFVNYVRVPGSARGFMLDMLPRPSFHTHVRRILRTYDMSALPLLAKPAITAPPGRSPAAHDSRSAWE